jgi:hypothetical protein
MGVALIGVSVLAAWFTKVCVEDPLRVHSLVPARRAVRDLSVLCSLSVLLAFSAAALSKHQVNKETQVAEKLYRLSLNPGECFGGNAALSGADCRNLRELDDPDYAFQAWRNQIEINPNSDRKNCLNERRDVRVMPCSFGVKDGDEHGRVALLGDSHAGMWAASLGVFAQQLGLRVDVYTAASCPPTLMDDVFSKTMDLKDRTACAHWRREAIKRIEADPKVKFVVISGFVRLHERLRDGQWEADDGSGYATTWQRFLDAGKKVVVIDDIPELPFYFANCLAMHHGNAAKCSYERTPAKEPSPYAKAVGRIASKGIALISFDDVLCDTAKCYPVVGGIPAYVDEDHVSAPFARSVASTLRNAIERAGE